MSHIHWRGNTYVYIRRVPKKYEDLDKRKFAKKTLETDSLEVATVVAARVNMDTERYWENLTKMDEGDARQKYEAAVELAKSQGLQYKLATELTAGDVNELVRRVLMVKEGDTALDSVFLYIVCFRIRMQGRHQSF